MLRFGILGAGRIGKVHARTIAASSPKAKVAYMADAVPAAAEALAKPKYGAKVASVDEIIGSKDVDAILIGTPTDFHAEQIEAGLQRRQGRSVREAGSRSVDAHRGNPEGGGEEQVDADDRLQPPLRSQLRRTCKRASASGDIGDVEMVTVISRDPAPPPPSYVKGSGGLFRDMMIHDFDMARFLMGEEFVIVNALGSSLVDKAIGEMGDVDTAAVQMQTAIGQASPSSPTRAAPPMAMTSAWRCTARKACSAPPTSTTPRSNLPTPMASRPTRSRTSSSSATWQAYANEVQRLHRRRRHRQPRPAAQRL